MKKHNLLITALALLCAMTSVQANVVRYAQCTFRPSQFNCSSKEIKQAKRWVDKAGISTVRGAAKKAGITITDRDTRAAQEKIGGLVRSAKARVRIYNPPNW